MPLEPGSEIPRAKAGFVRVAGDGIDNGAGAPLRVARA